MDATTRPQAAARRRLNPFSFPSDTTFRFVLLIVAVVSSSLYVYNVAVYFQITPRHERAAYIACQEPLRQVQAAGMTLPRAELDALSAEVDECKEPYSRRMSAVALGGVVGLLVVAGLIFMATPSWLIRRRRLEPLSDDDAPGVAAHVHALATEAGLARRPELLWNPLAPGGSALAFGRPGRSYVAVGAGLVIQFYKHRPAFDAIIRHELAHLVNRDVSTAYLTVSIWRAFVVVALLPLAVLVVDQPAADIWNIAWHAAALALIVYLIRNGVLRAREYYADVRASQWGDPRSLPAVLAAMPAGASPWWRRWLSVHPAPAQRVAVLDDTRALFRLSVWDALGAGVMAGLALPLVEDQLHTLINALGTPVSYLNAPAGSALIVASLMGTVVGVGIWRAAFGARLGGDETPRAGRIGVGLAAGFVLGHALELGASGLPLLRATFVGATLAVMALLVGWLVATADASLDAVPAARSARVFSAAGLFAAGLAAWAVGRLWVFDNPMVDLGGRWLQGWMITLAEDPVTIAAAAGICALPILALVFGGGRARPTPGWVWLDAPIGRDVWPVRPRPRLATVVRWGLAAGIAYAAVVVVFHVSGAKRSGVLGSLGAYFFEDLLSQFSGDERREAAWVLGWAEFQRFLALALVAVAAAGAAAGARGSRVLHGLFAGSLAGVVMVVTVVAVNAAAGGAWDASFIWLWTKNILVLAVFVALASGIAVNGLLDGLHRVRGRQTRARASAADQALAPA